MSFEAQRGKRQGTFAVLALLFGLVLGSGGAVSRTLETDAPASRITPARPDKAPSALRITQRDQQDDADDLSDVPSLPPLPRIFTATATSVPAAAAASKHDQRTGGHSASPYQARAPPAA